MNLLSLPSQPFEVNNYKSIGPWIMQIYYLDSFKAFSFTNSFEHLTWELHIYEIQVFRKILFLNVINNCKMIKMSYWFHFYSENDTFIIILVNVYLFNSLWNVELQKIEFIRLSSPLIGFKHKACILNLALWFS